jgi:hypothetical protein
MTTDFTHTPHPGSRLDAVNQAAAQETPVAGSPDLAGKEEFTVSVRMDAPEIGYPQSISLSSTNQYGLLLPQDPLRRNALVLAVDNDIYLCATKEAAQAVAGGSTSSGVFYLPKTILMAVPSKSQVWAACTTTSGNSRVSVFVSRDE